MGVEKRKHKRINIIVSVDLSQESKLQKFYTKNLSKGGIYLLAGELIPVGSKVTLEFYIKELKRKFKVNAVVAHHHVYETFGDDLTLEEKHGMGLKFVDLSDEDQKITDGFIVGKELKQGV